MKLRVVGWVCYDDNFPEGDNGWAARNAIIDDIRKNKYDFTGWHHQEGYNCTPLLNDGKKYCYSQRGWGDVMAEAHGDFDAMGYAKYFVLDEVDEMARLMRHDTFTRPKPMWGKVPPVETDLNETFELQVTQEQFDNAADALEIRFGDYKDLRYLYKGDTLVLVCGDKRAEYTVTDAERKHFSNKRKRKELLPEMQSEDRAVAKRASAEYNKSTLVLVVKLAKPEK